MKTLLALSFVAALTVVMPASAEFLYSFNDLSRACQSKNATELRGCFMFIMGVWQGVLHGDVIGRTTVDDIKNNREPTDVTTICVPAGTQFADLAMNVIADADRYIQRHPADGSQPAVTIITTSLMKNYACANSAWIKAQRKQQK